MEKSTKSIKQIAQEEWNKRIATSSEEKYYPIWEKAFEVAFMHFSTENNKVVKKRYDDEKTPDHKLNN